MTGIAGLDPLHLNADDRIGRVQHLELTQDDLDHIYGLAPLQRTLVFERRKDNGDVTDRWRRGRHPRVDRSAGRGPNLAGPAPIGFTPRPRPANAPPAPDPRPSRRSSPPAHACCRC